MRIRNKHIQTPSGWGQEWKAWCSLCGMEVARWHEPVNSDTRDLWTTQLQEEHEQVCSWRDPDWTPPLEEGQVACWDGEEWHVVRWGSDTSELEEAGLVVKKN